MRRWPALALAPLLGAGGCLSKTLEVSSSPAGAQVIVNGQPLGVTPATVSFRHHGLYRVELRRSGFRPLVASERLGRRLYELELLDVLADFLWPGVIRDRRRLHYRLEPTAPLDKDKLFAEARAAAAEAERLIPRLVEMAPPRPGAKDRDLIRALEPPGSKRRKPEAAPPEPPKPPEPPELPEPPDLP